MTLCVYTDRHADARAHTGAQPIEGFLPGSRRKRHALTWSRPLVLHLPSPKPHPLTLAHKRLNCLPTLAHVGGEPSSPQPWGPGCGDVHGEQRDSPHLPDSLHARARPALPSPACEPTGLALTQGSSGEAPGSVISDPPLRKPATRRALSRKEKARCTHVTQAHQPTTEERRRGKAGWCACAV